MTASTGGWSRRVVWLLGAVVLGAIALGAAWWGWAHRSRLRYVTATVTRGDISRTVSMTGSLNPVVTAQVSSYVSGNIKAWYCDYNTVVKIGQRCALIDPLPFQVVVDEDMADQHTAEAQLVKDQAALGAARVIYQRDLKLLDQGIVSQEQVDTDKSAYDQDRAEIDLDNASIAEKKSALQAAQVNLAYTDILSPVNGMVITRYIDIGQTVVSSTTASTLFLIGRDMSKMQVDTNVSEADIGGVQPGQRAYFTVQAYPQRTFWSTVRQVRVGPITVQNVVTYDVVLDVDNTDHALLPGMTADAHIITAERDTVLRVPLPATRFVPAGQPRLGAPGGRAGPGGRPRGLARGPGGRGGAAAAGGRSAGADGAPRATLWVLQNGSLQPLHVRTGLDDGTLVEVDGAGLAPGEQVVINAVRPGSARADDASRPAGGFQARGGIPRL